MAAPRPLEMWSLFHRSGFSNHWFQFRFLVLGFELYDFFPNLDDLTLFVPGGSAQGGGRAKEAGSEGSCAWESKL